MATTCVTKISILLFYRRLASGTVSRVFQMLVWTAIASVVAYFLVFFTMLFFVCRPFHAYWKLADYTWLYDHKGDFTCWPEGLILVISAAISAFQDVVACFLPMILFWKLRIPMRQKIALGAIFALGFL